MRWCKGNLVIETRQIGYNKYHVTIYPYPDFSVELVVEDGLIVEISKETTYVTALTDHPFLNIKEKIPCSSGVIYLEKSHYRLQHNLTPPKNLHPNYLYFFYNADLTIPPELIKDVIKASKDDVLQALLRGGINQLYATWDFKAEIDKRLETIKKRKIALFRHGYIFKLNGEFIVTTGCSTKFYVIKSDGSIFLNDERLVKYINIDAMPYYKTLVIDSKNIIPKTPPEHAKELAEILSE